MAFLIMPISNVETNYEFSTTLDEVTYNFGFRFNFRSQLWMIDIFDTESNPVYLGIPIYVNTDVFAQLKSYNIPQSLMICINNAANAVQPDRDTFSDDVVLLYEVA